MHYLLQEVETGLVQDSSGLTRLGSTLVIHLESVGALVWAPNVCCLNDCILHMLAESRLDPTQADTTLQSDILDVARSVA